MKTKRYLYPRDYRKLKKQWQLVLKNDWRLNHQDYYTHRLYEDYVSEYVMAECLLSISPVLAKSYQIINSLKWSLTNQRFDRFKQTLMDRKLESYPRRVPTALTTLEKYHVSIDVSFIYTLSNGPIEGINNKIKKINRSGYGYRNFQNLRNRLLISFTLMKDSRKTKALYYDSKH